MNEEHDPLAGLSRRELRELRARLDQAEQAADAADAAASAASQGAAVPPVTRAPQHSGTPDWDVPTEAMPIHKPAGVDPVATVANPTFPDNATRIMPLADDTRTEAMPFGSLAEDVPRQTPAHDPYAAMREAQAAALAARAESFGGAQDPFAAVNTTPPLGAPLPGTGMAGGGSGTTDGGDDMASADKPRKSHRARNITLIVLLVLLVCVAWLGVRVVMVKNSLQSAQRVVTHVQQDPDSIDAALPVLGDYAGSAASVKWDPIWRVSEFIPWAGVNLKGVRLAAESLDVASNDLAVPALEAMHSDSDTPILQRVLPILTDVQPKITSLADKIHKVADSSSLVGPVRDGVDTVDKVMQQAGPAIGVAPGLLGADGEKNYLLVFMNNAESVGLAGSAASQTLVNVNDGKIEITAQAGSGQFDEKGGPVDVKVDQSALDLYTNYLVDHVNTTASRPDFPTMAALDRAFWNRDIGDQKIDGVVGMDPIALSYILDATGPINIEETGDTLTSANAVQLLLSDVYARWNSYEDPEIVDSFFAGVASKVFDKIATGDFDMITMVSSLGRGIDQGSLLFHSFDDETQSYIQHERVSGILPTSNDEESVVGVYFRDESTSKIDYYMKSNIDVTQACTEAGASFDVTTTLHMDVPTFAGLPDYVKPQNPAFLGVSRTAVYVYGPPGTTLDSVEVEGRQVEIQSQDIDDLGRPVAFVWAYLGPTEQATVHATFSGKGDFGPAAVWSTPMVNASTGTVTPCA